MPLEDLVPLIDYERIDCDWLRVVDSTSPAEYTELANKRHLACCSRGGDMRLRVMASAAAALAVLAGALVTASPAFASTPPQCTSFGCDYTDPPAMFCDRPGQVITVNPSAEIRQNGVLVAVVELRYSYACNTNWGRIINYKWGQNKVYIQLYRPAPQAVTRQTGGSSTDYYSDQLYGFNMTVCAVGTVEYPSGARQSATSCG